MADTITIGCFLEDIGQERFITALILRVAIEIGLIAERLRFEFRNASGGGGKAVSEFQRFLRDCRVGDAIGFDILVVAIDGNCKGVAEVTNRLREITDRNGYAGAVVYAIPDPHIEKWYMADVSACQKVLDTTEQPQCPAYKCEKGRYKRAFTEAIRKTGVIPLQGGSEYAPAIADQMDLFHAGKRDESLGRFLDDMRPALRAFYI